MKKIFFSLFALAALAGCRSDEADMYSSSEVIPTVGIADDQLKFDGKTEKAAISIEANFWWRAAVSYPAGNSEDWCRITPDEGYGNIEIEAECSRNYTSAARYATITVTSDGGDTPFTKSFTVTQNPSSLYIEVEEVADAGTYNVPVVESSNLLGLMVNGDWTATVSGNNTDWCTVSASGQAGLNDFALDCAINTSGEPRSATVTIALASNTSIKYAFAVNQSSVFEKSALTVLKSPTAFEASWTSIVGATGYMIDVYDAVSTLKGTIDCGTSLAKNLAEDPLFAGSTPTYAGYVNLVLRTLSSDAAVYSESEPVASNSHFTSGKGTQAEPFIIGDIQSLNNITAANTVAVNAGAYYKLDFTPVLDASFVPVCTPTAPFKGIFDGNNKTISDWAQTIQADVRNYTGLFGGLDVGANVSNLTFTNCSIALSKGSGSVSSTNNGFAFLASHNRGTISNVVVNNPSITTVAGTSPVTVGAIAGANDGTITGCKTTGGKISAATDRNNNDVFYCGGIAGENNSTGVIENSANAGTEIYAMDNIGGVVGRNDGLISRCSNSGKVTGVYYMGGIAGYVKTNDAPNFKIENCCNTGEIHLVPTGGRGAAYVGGIVSRIYSPGDAVVNCYNSGQMFIGVYNLAGSACRIGGLVGHINRAGHIKNSYFSGTITVAGKNNLGGLVGELVNNRAAVIENCYSVGKIVITDSNADSNVNDAFGFFTNGSINVITSVYTLSNGGTNFAGPNAPTMTDSGRRTEAELKGGETATTFVDWDFSAVWQRNTSGSYLYPTLRSNPQ